MTRCQHCNKLAHSEHLVVEYDPGDHEKVFELSYLKDWKPVYLYTNPDVSPQEYGKLKCGDIWIHFRIKIS
jgi:hypothetical protein